MVAIILIVLTILLQADAWSLDLIADRRLITATVSLNHKSALLNKHNQERP